MNQQDMIGLSSCAIFQGFCPPDLNLSDRVASADSVQGENWLRYEVGVSTTTRSFPALSWDFPKWRRDHNMRSFQTEPVWAPRWRHLWSAEIGPDWNWGGGDARMIPPLKLRGSGIADPGTQERGGGGFTVRSGIQGVKEGILNSRKSTKRPSPKTDQGWLFGRRTMVSSKRCTIPGNLC